MWQSAARSYRSHPRRWQVTALATALTITTLTALIVTRHDPGNAPSITAATGGSVLYAEFGATADTVYLTDPANPEDRRKLFTLPHGQDYGIVGAVSPDGTKLAYTALPAGSKASASSPDQPADLWVVDVAPGAKPRLLIEAGVDLLVAPKWSSEGDWIMVRQPYPPNDTAIVLVDPDTGPTQDYGVADARRALFPVYFEDRSPALYYVTVDAASSDLWVVTPSAPPIVVLHLADGLTRDWAYQPSGMFAYLRVETIGGRFVTTPQVSFINPKALPIAGLPQEAFGPIWSPNGTFTYGRPPMDGKPSGVVQSPSLTRINGAGTPVPGESLELTPPARGFDVPLAWSGDSQSLAVRSFEGTSAQSPGRASLAVVSRDGARHTIATGEVTFLGWINP